MNQPILEFICPCCGKSSRVFQLSDPLPPAVRFTCCGVELRIPSVVRKLRENN